MKIQTLIPFQKHIFGYDIFISYSRKDGLDYSYNIAKYFIEKGYECFIDQISYLNPGKELPLTIQRAIRKCQAFIIVGSDGACQSKFVEREIELFLRSGSNKPMIPISFEGSIGGACWFANIEGNAIVNESKDSLNSGHPSANVLERIENALLFTKKSAKLRRISITVGLITLLLSGLAVFFINKAMAASSDLEDTKKELAISKSDLDSSGKKLRVTQDSTVKLALQLGSATSQLDSTSSKLSSTALLLNSTTFQLDFAKENLKSSENQLREVNTQLHNRQYELEITRAFEDFRQGNKYLQSPEPGAAYTYFTNCVKRLDSLQLDPLIGLHAVMATNLVDLQASSIIDIEPAASLIKVSENDKQVLVVYDHQNFGGQPDVEDILDWTAFAVYDLASGKQIMDEPIKTKIGRFVYDIHPSDIFSFEESGHIILNRSNDDSIRSLERYSLKDGSLKVLTAAEISRYKRKTRAKDGNYDAPDLYVMDPDDGIDVEYGRRLKDKVVKESPNGRTMVVGTYEGKIMLLDNITGHKRGEIKAEPVFAADYTSDGSYAYVADEANIWKVDATGWSQVHEMSIPLLFRDSGWKRETILEVTISEDGKLVAFASEYRLMVYDKQKKDWTKWELPDKIDTVSAMNIDVANKKVTLVGDNGSIFTADYVTQKTNYKKVQASASSGGSIVAWIEPGKPIAWIASKSITPSPVVIHKIPIYENPGNFEKIEVKIPGTGLDEAESNPQEIHALTKIGNQLVLVFGDSESFEDQHALIPEQLMIVPIDAPQSARIETLYGFTHFIDNLGEPHWNIPRINKISSVSNEGLFIAKRDWDPALCLSIDGIVRPILSNLETRDIVSDKDGGYNIALNSLKSRIELTISHLRRNESFRYELPWKFADEPSLAAICPRGRKIVVVSKSGDVLLVDVPN